MPGIPILAGTDSVTLTSELRGAAEEFMPSLRNCLLSRARQIHRWGQPLRIREALQEPPDNVPEP